MAPHSALLLSLQLAIGRRNQELNNQNLNGSDETYVCIYIYLFSIQKKMLHLMFLLKD